MSEAIRKFRRRWAMRTAAPMFWISALFLANTAISIVLWVDVPRVSEAYLERDSEESEEVATNEGRSATAEIDRLAHQLELARCHYNFVRRPLDCGSGKRSGRQLWSQG